MTSTTSSCKTPPQGRTSLSSPLTNPGCTVSPALGCGEVERWWGPLGLSGPLVWCFYGSPGAWWWSLRGGGQVGLLCGAPKRLFPALSFSFSSSPS